MAARGVLRTGEAGRLFFHCPGCLGLHAVPVGDGPGPRWGWNGCYDRPTFTPSVLVTWRVPSAQPGEFDDETKDQQRVCHSFVTDGEIQFLSDCTHALAGRTLPLRVFNGGAD